MAQDGTRVQALRHVGLVTTACAFVSSLGYVACNAVYSGLLTCAPSDLEPSWRVKL